MLGVVLMVAPSAVVKNTARAALKGNFLKGAIAALVLLFATLICVCSAGLFGMALPELASVAVLIVLGTFLLFPLFLGVLRFFWRMLWESDDDVVIVFYYYSSKELYRRTMNLAAIFVLRLLAIGFALMIPAILVDIFSSEQVYTMLNLAMPLWVSNLIVLSVFLKSTAAIVLFFIMLRYYLAGFLLIADGEMDPAEAMHMSSVIAKGTGLDFVFLILGLGGWILLSVFVFPLVFTMPYFLTAYLVHCRYAVTQYNRIVSRINTEQTTPTYATGI